jgi:hypothetical protein
MRYGRLLLLEEEGRTRAKHRCLCECGAEVSVELNRLRSGNTSSCGCLRRDLVSKKFTKHGRKFTPEYSVWIRIRHACSNPKHPDYKYYGARGIGVCKEWNHSFIKFHEYMGDRPTENHTIDRIDNDRGYEPGNCKWATRKEQSRNRRNTKFLTLDGISKPMAEWCEIYGKPYDLVNKRIWRGWNAKDALTIEKGETK